MITLGSVIEVGFACPVVFDTVVFANIGVVVSVLYDHPQTVTLTPSSNAVSPFIPQPLYALKTVANVLKYIQCP